MDFDLDNKEVDVFPFKETVSVEISGFFYAKITNLLMSYCSEKQRELPAILKQLQTREPENEFENNVITLLTLIKSIEEAAKEKGVIQKQLAKKLTQEGGAES